MQSGGEGRLLRARDGPAELSPVSWGWPGEAGGKEGRPGEAEGSVSRQTLRLKEVPRGPYFHNLTSLEPPHNAEK